MYWFCTLYLQIGFTEQGAWQGGEKQGKGSQGRGPGRDWRGQSWPRGCCRYAGWPNPFRSSQTWCALLESSITPVVGTRCSELWFIALWWMVHCEQISPVVKSEPAIILFMECAFDHRRFWPICLPFRCLICFCPSEIVRMAFIMSSSWH